MGILLNPLDTLFFRDGKPFSMGYETWAKGMFPPLPSVLYGALRTAYFSDAIVELKNANTGSDKTSELKIDFFSLYSDDKFYFPCPLDIVEKKEKNKGKPEYAMLTLVKKPENYYSALNLPYVLQTASQVEEVSGLISHHSLNDYLQKNKTPEFLAKGYLKEEPKVGIAKNSSTNTSDDGMMYRVGMNRLDNFGFAVGYSDMPLSQSGFMRLGGEGKAVSFLNSETFPDIKMPESLSENVFKIYLTTPAIFNNGWYPSREKIGGMELIAAVVGKPVYIGGFDMKPKDGKTARPKPMRRAVPAGSVYYYKAKPEEFDFAKIHGASISDYNADQGFGIVYVGDVKNREQ